MLVKDTPRICPVCAKTFFHPWRGIKHCSYKCAQQSRKRSLEGKFWPRVQKKSDSECWPWIGSLDRNGYGQLDVRAPRMMAHRAAYIIFNGPIPKGLGVLHHCDNPRCCNPRHLHLGTALDNSRDAIKRGRTARGAGHGHAKLNPEVVLILRGMNFTLISKKHIAELLNCSRAAINKAVNRKNWKYLQ